MDSTWIPVVSGAVGAGGAVGAQVVAAYFTSRREKRATENARLDRRAELFRDEKRVLFLECLQLFDRQLEILTFADPTTASARAEEWNKSHLILESEWYAIVTRVMLLAPELIDSMSDAEAASRQFEASLSSGTQDAKDAATELLQDSNVALILEMRKSLGAEDDTRLRESRWRRE